MAVTRGYLSAQLGVGLMQDADGALLSAPEQRKAGHRPWCLAGGGQLFARRALRLEEARGHEGSHARFCSLQPPAHVVRQVPFSCTSPPPPALAPRA